MAEENKKSAEKTKDAAPQDEKKAGNPPVELSGTKKLMVMGGVVVALLVVMSIITFVMLNRLKPEDPEIIAERIQKQKEEEEIKKETEVGETLPDPITVLVNLAGPDADRFLKAELVLEYLPKAEEGGGGGGHGEGEGKKKAPPEIEKRLPKLKDIAIGVLSSCTLEDVKDRDAKKKVLLRLKNEMNKVFPEPETITNVYFSGFIVQ